MNIRFHMPSYTQTKTIYGILGTMVNSIEPNKRSHVMPWQTHKQCDPQDHAEYDSLINAIRAKEYKINSLISNYCMHKRFNIQSIHFRP